MGNDKEYRYHDQMASHRCNLWLESGHWLANALEEQQADQLVKVLDEEGCLGCVLCVLVKGCLVQSSRHSGMENVIISQKTCRLKNKKSNHMQYDFMDFSKVHAI